MALNLLYRRQKGNQTMEMLLMALCISLFGLAVTAAAFNAAAPPEVTPMESLPAQEMNSEPVSARFFAAQPRRPMAPQPEVPIEALLLQIDNHVRLEQAAVESFIQQPSIARLYGRTVSTLVH